MGGVWICLLLGTLQGFQSQTVHVSQIPVVATTVGSSVTLPCNYSVSGAVHATSGFYKWYRHIVKIGPEVSDSNGEFTGRVSKVDANEFIHSRLASIVLQGALVSDTGLYYCAVTLYDGREITGHGNGTFLNVTELQLPSCFPALQTQQDNTWSLTSIITTVAAVIVLLGLVGCLLCYIKQATRGRREVGPVIYADCLSQDRRHIDVQRPALPQPSPEESDCTTENLQTTMDNYLYMDSEDNFLDAANSVYLRVYHDITEETDGHHPALLHGVPNPASYGRYV